MKKILFAIALLTFGTALLAMPATGVANTFHDLSYATGISVKISNAAAAGVPANTLNQLCIWCHTPHHAIGSVSSETAGEPIADQLIPLWNHTPTAAAFTMYNNTNNPLADLQGTVDAAPGGASLACLSCHDGTVAMGAVRTKPYWASTITYANGASYTTHVDTTTGLMLPAAFGYVGTDLTNDHPISITYVAADTALKDPTTFAANGVKLFPSNAFNSKVECASCHNPHNYGTTGTTAPFLNYSMAGSAMCLQCHTK